MANWSDPRIGASQPTTTIGRDVAYDAGLRSHMLSVYNYMTSGVLLTGIVAMLFASWSGAPAVLFGPGPLKYLIMFSPLAFVMVLSFGINRLSTGTAQAAVLGLRRGHGPVDGVDLLRLYRGLDRDLLLRDRGAASPASASGAIRRRRICPAWAPS